MKNILHGLPDWNYLLPEEKANLDELKPAVVRKAGKLSQSSRAGVAPIKHTIKIDPVG